MKRSHAQFLLKIILILPMLWASHATAGWDDAKPVTLDEVKGDISNMQGLIHQKGGSPDWVASIDANDAFFSPDIRLAELEPLLKGAVDHNIAVGRTAAIAWYHGYGFKKDVARALKSFRLASDLDWIALVLKEHPEIQEGRKETIALLKKDMAAHPDDDDTQRGDPIYISMINGEEMECEDATVPCGCGEREFSAADRRSCMGEADELERMEAWAKFNLKLSKKPAQARQAYFTYRSAALDFDDAQAWYECKVLGGGGTICLDIVASSMSGPYSDYDEFFDGVEKFVPNFSLTQTDFDAADAKLNKNYAAAAKFAAEADGKDSLKKTELAWIHYRDAKVAAWLAFHPDATKAEKHAAELTLKIQMSEERAAELLQRSEDD